MVDQNITQLTETTTLDDTDLTYVVRDPAGTPVDNKMSVLNLKNTIGGTSKLEVASIDLGARVLAYDTFDRATSSTLGTTDTGETWEDPGSMGWGIVAGGYAKHTFTGGSNERPAFINLATNEVDVRARVNRDGTGRLAGVAVAGIDHNNFIWLDFEGTRMSIHSRVAGVEASLAESNILGSTPNSAPGQAWLEARFVLIDTGSQFELHGWGGDFYVGAVLSGSDYTTLAGATRCGIWANSRFSQIDNFIVRKARV